MLLYLNDQTWSNARLAEEVRRVRARGGALVMAHENDAAKGGCAFDSFFRVTPQDLISDGLYGPIAVALHTGEHRRVSMQLLAEALSQGQSTESALAATAARARRLLVGRRKGALADEDHQRQIEMRG